MIVYRRSRAQMPAHEDEATDAEREGVRINWLRTIAAFEGPELTVEVMELDEAGRPHPTGRLETLAADTIIMAVGQDADTAFLRPVPGVEFQQDGTVVVSSSMMTGCPGVFAGGDMVPSERTVTVGVGHGKKAAGFIDAYLQGDEAVTPAKNDLAGFDRLHPWYFADAERRRQPEREPGGRTADFTEVVGGLSGTRRSTRRAAACRAATASSAMAASALARRTRSSRYAPAARPATSTARTTPTCSIMTAVPAARSVATSARFMPSR
jgi:hypothetical protein